MDTATGHEGTFDRKRLSAADYERIVSILTAGGRRAFVEVDGDKLDTPEHLTASRVAAAREVDISSYWSDPGKPHWGRRHFVYLVADRAGVRYFGDSVSPEVTDVCEKLGQYLGMSPAHRPISNAPSHFVGPFARLHPATWPAPYNRTPAWAVPTLVGVLLFVVAFLLGRASVDTGGVPILVTPPNYGPPPVMMPASQPLDGGTPDAHP